jgi:integrase
MEHTYSTSTLLRTNSDGRALIFVRITVNSQRAEISVQRHIEVARWDKKRGRVKGNNEDAREINDLIDKTILKLNSIHSACIQNSDVVTAASIKEKFYGKQAKSKNLMDVFQQHNDWIKERIGIDYAKATHRRFTVTYEHIAAFIKLKYKLEDIPLRSLKYSFVTDFEHYLKTVRRCNHNSSLKYVRIFRRVINKSVVNGWLEKDPFVAYRAKLKECRRVILTADELQTLATKVIDTLRLDQVRDVFVFCCYTGLSYVDVEKLNRSHIVKGFDGEYWINIDRTKTGSSSNVPLLPKAIEIIEKYKNNTERGVRTCLLPVISNQRLNAYLKELCVICGLNKKLTFHSARHTFATTVTLTNGVPLETVSSMLGHKNIRTTQLYAKVVQEKVSRDMQTLRKSLVANAQ